MRIDKTSFYFNLIYFHGNDLYQATLSRKWVCAKNHMLFFEGLKVLKVTN